MKTCAASSCTNTSYNSPYLTWHSLPLDSYIRDDWIELLGIDDDDDDDSPKVCSTHFRPCDFQSNNRLLKSSARPSLRLAKAIKPVKKDKSDLEDYVASESDEEISVISSAPATKTEASPSTSTRPSRKAAQKAAEKLKKYCYASPPSSPPSPGSPSESKPSTSRASTSRASTSRASTSRTPVHAYQKPVSIAPAGTGKPLYTLNTGQPVTVVRGNFVKYTTGLSPYHTVQTGVNVTQVPLKPPSEDTHLPRHSSIYERTGVNVTLQMECYEELLSPAQVSKNKKMETDAASFNQTLRTLRANNVTIIHHTDPFVKVTNTVTMVTSQLTNGVGGSSAATKTTDVLKSTPSLGIVTSQNLSAGTLVKQTPLMIAQSTPPMQILRPSVPQQTILLSSPTVSTAPAANALNLVPTVPAQVQYKVLLDPRTSFVVGTVAQPVSNQIPVITQSVANQPSPVTVTRTQNPSPALAASSTSSPQIKEPSSTVAENTLQSKTINNNNPSDQSGCVYAVEGGDKEVTAETLLGIKAVSGSFSKWNKMIQQSKPILQAELEKENFFSEPLRWMLKMNLIVAESACRSCSQGRYCLVPDNSAQDGFKWLCNKARCAKILPVQRLYFFSRFGCSLNRLLPLVFHWAVQTNIQEIKSVLKVDIYVIRSVWRALQEVCTRAVVIKARKLGGPGKVVEVVTAQLSQDFWVVAAMERKSGYVRLKVVRSEPDWNSFANLQKILEPWLMYKTVIMSPERSLRGMGRIGYVFTLVDRKPPHSNPQVLIHAYNISKYVKTHLSRMFGEFKLSDMKLDTVQGFLDELQWRNRFGRSPRDSFCYIFKDIAEQSGRVVNFPPADFGLNADSSSSKDPPEVTLSSDTSSSESDNDTSSVDSPTVKKTPAPSPAGTDPAKKASSFKTYSHHKGNNPNTSSGSNTRQRSPQGSDGNTVTVVLDRYYYAIKHPDPELAGNNLKGNYQFKCIICKKIIDNNLKVMKHMVGHMEENRNRNPDLSDLTQCKYCFRDFDTPFSMQCHMESVHLNTSALSCQICNQAFNSAKDLSSHMRWTHVKAEMPYTCQVCNYRSSFHRDVLEHFQVAHNNTDKLLCHYCLRVYSTRFSGPEHVGHLQNFYYHLYKHQGKSTTKKCNACCLVFLTPNDVKKHKTIDHVSLSKDKNIVYGSPKSGQEVIHVKDPQMRELSMSDAPKKAPGRFGRPTKYSRQSSHDDEISNEALAELDPVKETDNSAPLVLSQDYTSLQCVECNNVIDPEHFSKSVSCSRCFYSTYCSKAFVEHMISEHSQLDKKRTSVFSFKPPTCEKPYFCPCGYQSNKGNRLATHMKSCGRKTCYSDWMKAVSSLVKVEPGSENLPPLERGSAFFPPLIVLDENEEEYVNQTLSTIPEPEPGIKPGVAGRRKRSRDSQDQPPEEATPTAVSESKEPPLKKVACESEAPSWLNALGLVRRQGGSSVTDSEQKKGKEVDSTGTGNLSETVKGKDSPSCSNPDSPDTPHSSPDVQNDPPLDNEVPSPADNSNNKPPIKMETEDTDTNSKLKK